MSSKEGNDVTDSPIPIDVAAEADALEQQTPLVPEAETPTLPKMSTVEADGADLNEQAIPVLDAGEDA